MAEKESARAKLAREEAERAKTYKCPHDVERIDHLIHAAHLIRDYPLQAALAASIVRELHAMNLKQGELDAKEKEEYAKKAAEALASDTKPVVEEDEAWGTSQEATQLRAPSITNTSTQRR